MKQVLKKEDLFYDLARILINKYFEENPSNLAPDAEYSFTFCLESIPPIKRGVKPINDSLRLNEIFSAFAATLIRG